MYMTPGDNGHTVCKPISLGSKTNRSSGKTPEHPDAAPTTIMCQLGSEFTRLMATFAYTYLLFACHWCSKLLSTGQAYRTGSCIVSHEDRRAQGFRSQMEDISDHPQSLEIGTPAQAGVQWLSLLGTEHILGCAGKTLDCEIKGLLL
ncbi:hypothetical protein [Undibacterium sp. TS12]|uniref:hypothetical protein n=1 Tax=Undibacterium sp. TS12 TaxID=2908202 RepID=UPI001F4CA484|nr:hypothetical protein [Undibacterium sp. TS12]MCH8620401.1 hypothetical protein [Undibacterium sp. TS12]